MELSQISFADLHLLDSDAADALWSEEVVIEETDLQIFVTPDGVIYVQSHDEQDAHVWDASDKRWTQVAFPLDRTVNPSPA